MPGKPERVLGGRGKERFRPGGSLRSHAGNGWGLMPGHWPPGVLEKSARAAAKKGLHHPALSTEFDHDLAGEALILTDACGPLQPNEKPRCASHRGFATCQAYRRKRCYCQVLRYWRTSSAEYGFAFSSKRLQPVFE